MPIRCCLPFQRAPSGSIAQLLLNLCGTVSRLLQTPERVVVTETCSLCEVAHIKWKTTAVYICGNVF